MASRKVRVKKLSVKTPLPVLREDEIDPSEYDALITETQIATGVEQAEENEYHLQSILKDAGTSNEQEIPVPPPVESDIKYDVLYPSVFRQPCSYIRFSQTVEECIACQYDMTGEDDGFLSGYNRRSPATGPLSEDDFEHIMEVFENSAAEQAPYASVDNTLVPYEMMAPALNHLDSPSLLQHAKAVFEHWKTRRQATGNKPLSPALKFETHQETDDTDPYVCFRRREARQMRKTRARDNKIAETLKRLRRELEDGRQLILLSYEREILKRELLQMDRALFEERARLKQIKVRLGLKTDEDLVNQKKRKAADQTAGQRPSGTQLRAPVRNDTRPIEQEFVLLSDILSMREKEFQEEIECKVQNHRRWNANHIDLTRGPLSPRKDPGTRLKFRPAKTQYLMTPPASASSESAKADERIPEAMDVDGPKSSPIFHFQAGSLARDDAQDQLPSFRRRIGRLQRLWIDRRGLVRPAPQSDEYSDRWKYDSDDDGEPSVYEVDPFDTRALKFRASIPLGQYLVRGPPDAPHAGTQASRSMP